MPVMTRHYIAGLEGCSRVSQAGLGGGGIQGTDYTKLFSLPYFPFSFYLIRMKKTKAIPRKCTRSIPSALLMSWQKAHTTPRSGAGAHLETDRGPGRQALLWGPREAQGSRMGCLAETQAAARQLCAFGGFTGYSSKAWHRHFPPPVTAHTLESIKWL